jgi:hypothetical protein
VSESSGVQIKGGAGRYEAAAVLAVITHVLEEEEGMRAVRPASRVAPAWVRAVADRFGDQDALDPGINWPG